ncbi:MAG: homoserine dehydrogenase [Luteimonas sp.]
MRERGIALPDFAWLCNSRTLVDCGNGTATALHTARAAPVAIAAALPWADDDLLHARDIVIDATGSDAVAARHAEWLARSIHVVTANKLGSGADAARAEAIARAQRAGGTHYGDAATVGAGLPLLRTIRDLVAGGDRIHAIEGVLSGSLAWLFARFDDTRPFSDLVREACDAGYTEPDPRLDLCGEDVRRKLLILARAAGLTIDADAVRVDSLLPPGMDTTIPAAAALSALDAPIAERFRDAHRSGAVLRFVARVDAGGARVGMRAVPAAHALCGGSGTDNRVAIFSDRYRTQPLVIQGPGAGAEVTAAALLDDVLRIAAHP